MFGGGFSSVASVEKFLVSKAYFKLMDLPSRVSWGWLLKENKASPRTLFIVWLIYQQRLATTNSLNK